MNETRLEKHGSLLVGLWNLLRIIAEKSRPKIRGRNRELYGNDLCLFASQMDALGSFGKSRPGKPTSRAFLSSLFLLLPLACEPSADGVSGVRNRVSPKIECALPF